jgi:hypothetical protein
VKIWLIIVWFLVGWFPNLFSRFFFKQKTGSKLMMNWRFSKLMRCKSKLEILVFQLRWFLNCTFFQNQIFVNIKCPVWNLFSEDARLHEQTLEWICQKEEARKRNAKKFLVNSTLTCELKVKYNLYFWTNQNKIGLACFFTYSFASTLRFCAIIKINTFCML